MPLLRLPFVRCLLRNVNVSQKLAPNLYSTNRGKNRIFNQRSNEEPEKSKTISDLVVPLPVNESSNPDDINVGQELSGFQLKKSDVLKLMSQFLRRQPIRVLAEANGIDSTLFQQCFNSFRNYCLNTKVLPPELHIRIGDIIHGQGHVDDLFVDFLKHSREIFPHLECMDELKKISDLSSPLNWYQEARGIKRKIIFHSGPTNSGKTYHALKRFLEAESGVYCAPLKLLAVEVNTKSNEAGTKCDLITGEERLLANEDGTPSSHVACTIEMASVTNPCEVAIIDEIQMIKDWSRGWAWTRALLGIPAQEIHLCGEEAAVDLVKQILSPIGEEVEVCRYKRLTPLHIEDTPLGVLENAKPGDCIVCFNKNDIFEVSLKLESIGRQVAVIYGSLPPGTKVLQTKKFNDPADPCKLLVATDAIGMGLNLNIKRIIFYSVKKPNNNEKGEVEMDYIPTSTALQIAGRAGRYSTANSVGQVTTFKKEDLPKLKEILAQPVDPVPAAGLHPTIEQIEMFSYHLPKATLSNLIDIFTTVCKVDKSNYFMCNVGNLKYFADLTQHVPLPLRVRYVFCLAPINRNTTFTCVMFLKFAKQYSLNEPITVDWLIRNMEWPLKPPQNIAQLVHLEAAFDVLDLYLWLSYRFPDLFPDAPLVKQMQKELDNVIHLGIHSITKLLKRELRSPSPEVVELMKRTRSTEERKDEETVDIGEIEVLEQEDRSIDAVEETDESNLSSTYEELSKEKTLSLTDKLIASGILTKKEIRKLHSEWKKNERKKNGSEEVNPKKESNKDVRRQRKRKS